MNHEADHPLKEPARETNNDPRMRLCPLRRNTCAGTICIWWIESKATCAMRVVAEEIHHKNALASFMKNHRGDHHHPYRVCVYEVFY